MFFFLSKTLSYLTMPLVVVGILLLGAWLIRTNKWKQLCFRGAIVLFFIFSNDFISNELMRLWEIPATPFAQTGHYQWGIMLTGVAKAEMQPNDRTYFAQAADRVVHTVQLYRLGHIERILISGGSGRLIDIEEREADQLRKALLVMGVPDSVVWVENQSRNTHESATAVVDVLGDSVAASQCILVTSAFHMRRSLACFKKEGWALDGFSTDFLTHPRKYTFDILFIPALDGWRRWHHLLKETIGYLSYWAVGYI